MKKLYAILLLGFSVFLTPPADGFSQHRGDGGYGGYRDVGYGSYGGYSGGGHGGYRDGRYGGYRGDDYYGGHRRHYGSHHNDDIFWGVTGFLFGTALGAAISPPPVYNYGPPVYYNQPAMCRYERYVTGQWGRTYVESFVAPCR